MALSGALEMLDGLVVFAEFFQSAAEVVARDGVERIDLNGGERMSCARRRYGQAGNRRRRD